MTNMNESGKKSASPSVPEEEEIIELTEILTGAIAEEDDDIIDLTDILNEKESDEEEIIELTDMISEKQIEPDAATGAPEEEDFIDLSALEQEAQTEEEDIIELLDAVEEPSDLLAEPNEALAGTQIFEAESLTESPKDAALDLGADIDTGDDIILLTDEAESLAPVRPTPSSKPIPIELEDSIGIQFKEPQPPEIDEELLELIESADGKDLNALLDDVAEESSIETETEEEEALDLEGDLLETDESADLTVAEVGGDESEKSGSFADSLGVDLVSALEPSAKPQEIVSQEEKAAEKKPGKMSVHVQNKREEGGPIDFKFESRLHPGEEVYRERYVAQEPPRVSQTDLERALEKVVRDMFAENIERMLTDIVQKVVTEEIRKIKKALLEE